MRSYRPEELFDTTGRLIPELAALAPQGTRRMSANPHANGGRLLRDLAMPDFRDYAVPVEQPRRSSPARPPASWVRSCATSSPPTRTGFGSWARTRPRPTGSRPVFETTDRAWDATDAAGR